MSDKHTERIKVIEQALQNIEKPRGNSIPIEPIVAIIIPLLTFIIILISNPSFFQKEDQKRNFKKIFIWFLVISILSGVMLGGWYFYRGKFFHIFY